MDTFHKYTEKQKDRIIKGNQLIDVIIGEDEGDSELINDSKKSHMTNNIQSPYLKINKLEEKRQTNKNTKKNIMFHLETIRELSNKLDETYLVNNKIPTNGSSYKMGKLPEQERIKLLQIHTGRLNKKTQKEFTNQNPQLNVTSSTNILNEISEIQITDFIKSTYNLFLIQQNKIDELETRLEHFVTLFNQNK